MRRGLAAWLMVMALLSAPPAWSQQGAKVSTSEPKIPSASVAKSPQHSVPQHSVPQHGAAQQATKHASRITAPALDPAKDAVLLEAVVATVNQNVITKGQVEAEARVVLLRRGGLIGAQQPVDDGLRAGVLQYLINQEVILAEARRLQLFQVPQDELQRELLRVTSLFTSLAEYQQFLDDNGLSPEDLKQIIRRDLRVGKFLDSRVRMLSEIDVEELRAYYLQHQQEYGGQSFEQVREALAARVGRQRSATAIGQWVDELRAQAKINILRPYADPAPVQP